MSTHGVSLDEEMVSMLEYQRMYEAAARVMTAIDEALDVLINRTGVVGR
jgi:flagellar hook-associated protein 1 FlgK